MEDTNSSSNQFYKKESNSPLLETNTMELAEYSNHQAQQRQYQQPYQQCNSRPKNSVIFPKEEDIAINARICPPIHDTASCWCSISYYEFDEQVGETFKSTARRVSIDGHCSTSDNNRFCLGMVINVNQNPVATKARRQIGKGCTIYQEAEGDIGDVSVECFSESPIFVQSPLHAALAKDDLSTVYRLPRGTRIKVFDMSIFEEMLKKATKDGRMAIYALQPMCNIRISFVKGYGSHYNRPTITATPCWVEIQFMGALQMLSHALDQMEILKIEISND